MKMSRFLTSVTWAVVFAAIQATSLQAKTESGQSVESDTSAIIDGISASVSSYPFIAFLADQSEEQFCGASLISETWILTAAHCFLNSDNNAVDIETGANSVVVLNSDTSAPFADNAIVGQINQIIVHPNYDPNPDTSENKDNFDIALVELTAAVSIQPVALMSANALPFAAGTEAIIMGWGTTAISDEGESINPSSSLLQASQKIVASADCDSIYGGGITDFMLCAGAVEVGGTTDTCQGDSGGPLVVSTTAGFVQIGVVSFGGTETGPSCGDPDAPGVYSNVAALSDFISSNVSDARFIDPVNPNPGGSTGGSSEGSSDTPANSSIELSIEVAGNNVLIYWTSLNEATGYRLYYAPIPSADPISTLDMGQALTISGDLPSGAAFYVAIEPYNENGALPILSNIAELIVP
jgi:secreted trypsin-like serine protease